MSERRPTMRKKRTKRLRNLTVMTLPNAYMLSVGDRDYLYFDGNSLIRGIIIHAGLRKSEYLTADDTQVLLDMALEWADREKLLNHLRNLEQKVGKLKQGLAYREKVVEGLRRANHNLREKLRSEK